MSAATMDSPVGIPEPDLASQLAVPAVWVSPVDAREEQCEVCTL